MKLNGTKNSEDVHDQKDRIKYLVIKVKTNQNIIITIHIKNNSRKTEEEDNFIYKIATLKYPKCLVFYNKNNYETYREK